MELNGERSHLQLPQYEQCRHVLLRKLQTLNEAWDDFIAAWIGYGLALDGVDNNGPLLDVVKKMANRLEEQDMWRFNRSAGPIAFTLWILKRIGHPVPVEARRQLIERIHSCNPDNKWSVLRDPEQVFLLALGANAIDDDWTGGYLIKIARSQIKFGSLRRKILYAAALRELGERVELRWAQPDGLPGEEADIIGLVWWVERYGGDKAQAWNAFKTIAWRLALECEQALDVHRILTVPEIVMLYEALAIERNLLGNSHPF